MKRFVLFVLSSMLAGMLIAQVPEGFKYQAVVHDQEILNYQGDVEFEITFYQDVTLVVYREKHLVILDESGLVRLDVGSGTVVLGAFNTIDWQEATLIGVVVKAGVKMLDMGKTSILSVPYALLAKEAVNDKVDDADADPGNELQTLSIAGDVLSLTDGGSITLPVDGDILATNELQTLSINDRVVSLTDGGSITLPVDQNTTYTAGTGISIVGTEIRNTKQDQTVVLTAGTGISVTGTYPSFTVTNTVGSGGTVPDPALPVPIKFHGEWLYVTPEDITNAAVYGADGTVAGAVWLDDGETNTQKIVLYATTGAAYMCDTLTRWGHTDWYLPAENELKAIYLQAYLLTGLKVAARYWSSTEINAASAVGYTFDSGGRVTPSKTSSYCVRCVRKD